MTNTGKYILIRRHKLCVINGPINDADLREAKRNLYLRGYYVCEIPKPPHERTLRKWRAKGIMKAIDGCIVEGGKNCSHNKRSWQSIFNDLINWKKENERV